MAVVLFVVAAAVHVAVLYPRYMISDLVFYRKEGFRSVKLPCRVYIGLDLVFRSLCSIVRVLGRRQQLGSGGWRVGGGGLLVAFMRFVLCFFVRWGIEILEGAI